MRLRTALQCPGRYPRTAMAGGALAVSASAIIVKLSGASPGTASFWRCILATPFLAALSAVEGRGQPRRPRHERAVAWLAGALFAGDMLLWTQSIGEVGAGLSTVLVNVQVVLVPLLALVIDREPLTARFLASLPVLLLGVTLAAGVIDGGIGSDPLLGSVHAILAAVCYAGFLYLLRRVNRQATAARSMLDVTICAAVVCLVAGALWHGVDVTPGWAVLGWMLLVALTSQVVGWLLVAGATGRLSSQVGAILLLLTPVGAVLLAFLILAERPTLLQLIGCVLVLGSVQVGTLRVRSRDERRHAAPDDRGGVDRTPSGAA
jgi:drug/metabolite transporter (DMT)-like permease